MILNQADNIYLGTDVVDRVCLGNKIIWNRRPALPWSDLIAYFQFDNEVKNLVGAKETWSTTNGKYTVLDNGFSAFDFDGTNFAEAPDNLLYSFAGDVEDLPFSVSFFAKKSLQQPDVPFINKKYNDDDGEWGVYQSESGVGMATGNWKFAYKSSAGINLLKHYVFTFDGNSFEIYIDGVKQSSLTRQQSNTYQKMTLNSAKARMGWDSDNSHKINNCQIAELCIWEKSLSAVEVGLLYDVQNSGSLPV